MRTASFKLAALYALIFGVSVVALAAVVYVITTTALDRQTRARIHSEAIELAQEYQNGGLDRLMVVIRQRQRGRLVGGLDYTVYEANGHRLFGTLPGMARTPGWSRMSGPPDGDEPEGELEQLIVYSVPLKGGYWLMVGDDIGRVERVGHLITTTFGWALVLMITLAAAGGIALSVGFLGRVDAITRTAEAIIGGNIHRRVPLRGTADDLDRLAATLNRMLDRIGALMENVKQVSSDVAHDLRTPLGHLRQTLDEARQNAKSTADYEAAVDRALAETDAILDTFTALLRIAQIEAGSRRIGFRPLDLSDLVASVGQTFVPVAEDENRSLAIDADPGLAIEGDRELLVQLLANLIENAIHHAGAGARIAVALKASASGPVLSVSDDGPGIPAEEREKVLQRFYRLERSRTDPGNGLGLALVAAIVDLHRASLALEDNRPGLRVTIRFTRLPEPAGAADENEAARAPAPGSQLGPAFGSG